MVDELPTSKKDMDESLRNSMVDMHVSTPLEIQMTRQGTLEIVFYQQIQNSTVPLRTRLLFEPDAAAQLIGGIHQAIQNGDIIIEASAATGSNLQ